MRKQNHNHHQKGELIVSGSDKIEIRLDNCPRHVQCFFKHPRHSAPCDPHHHKHDEFDWTVRRIGFFRYAYILTISWEVHDIREIVWSLTY